MGTEALVTKRLAFSVADSSNGDWSVMRRARRGAWARSTIGIGFLLLAPSGALAAQRGGRVLTASDVVAIRIVDHPDLDTTTRIEPDGTINFPYVGRIRAAGRTEDDLGRAIERRLIELKIISEP